jgi:hypothetical protein
LERNFPAWRRTASRRPAASRHNDFPKRDALVAGPAAELLHAAANEAHPFEELQTMKKQLVRISILQSSKVMTALYILMGFVYTLIGIPMVIFGSDQIRVIGIVYTLMPIILGVFGFIFFVIFAAVYNLLVKWLGGFEFEIKNID